MCFRLPASKLLSTLAKIKAFGEREERGWCPAADLASLVGSLSWCTAVVQGGRVFMRNMYTALAPAFVDAHGRPWVRWGAAPVALPPGFWADLQWWAAHLISRNHLPILNSTSPKVELGSDASDWHGGGVFKSGFGGSEIRVDFSPWEAKQSSNFHELLMCWWMLDLHGSGLALKEVLFRLDNQVGVSVITRGNSRSPLLMALMRRLYTVAALYTFKVSPVYTQGKIHLRCDGISRGQEPANPGWRIGRMWWEMVQDIIGAKFDLVSGQECSYAGGHGGALGDPAGRVSWVHPRFDQIATAIHWVVEAGLRDGDTSGVLLLPHTPSALWWPMMRYLSVVVVVDPESAGMQCLTRRGWVPRLPPHPLMLCAFPVGPAMSVVRARVGSVKARPSRRLKTSSGEARGTWLVMVMDPGERAAQELYYPEVRQDVWLCQVHGPQPADPAVASYRHWTKVVSGSPNDPRAFMLEKSESKVHHRLQVAECYWVTRWVDDEGDTRGRVSFDHQQWYQALVRHRRTLVATPVLATPILATMDEDRHREVVRMRDLSVAEVGPGALVSAGPTAWSTVLATEAAQSCAVRFEGRYPELVENPPGTEWMEQIGEVLVELQGTFGVNPLILVLCDTAASYLTRQGLVGAEERVTLRRGGSGGSGLDMSVEDDLSTQLMALFGADELHQLPTELGEAMTELSALQERGVAWSRGDSLVWLVPSALRSWVAMHSPGAGDDVVSQRSGAAPSIPESESVRSSVISRGWYQVPLRESVSAAEHYRPRGAVWQCTRGSLR